MVLSGNEPLLDDRKPHRLPAAAGCLALYLCGPLLQLVEQHRSKRQIVYALDLTVRAAVHQLGIDMLDLLGYQAILPNAIGIVLEAESHRAQPH